ncbi:MAG: RDD family protein [Bacteriovoracaceae bacterium]|nr:RDD family protein [Bacteriovoracaceae bacterium]
MDTNTINLVDYLKDKAGNKSVQAFHADNQIASLKKRFTSFAVDIYAITFIKILVNSSYSSFVKLFLIQLPKQTKDGLINGLTKIDPITSIVILYGYFVICFYLGEGKTFGGMYTKTRLINRADSNARKNIYPNLLEAFKRASGYVACYLTFGLGFLVPFFRKDRLGLADLFSATKTMDDADIYDLIFARNQTAAPAVVSYDWNSEADEVKKAA